MTVVLNGAHLAASLELHLVCTREMCVCMCVCTRMTGEYAMLSRVVCAYFCLAAVHSQVVDVIHGRLPNVSKSDLQARIAALYKVQDPSNVVLFGFRTVFGGGRSSGFALIYQNKEARIKYEPKHRLLRVRAVSHS